MRVTGPRHDVRANGAGKDQWFFARSGKFRHRRGGIGADNTGKDIDARLFKHGGCFDDRIPEAAAGVDKDQFNRALPDMMIGKFQRDFPTACNAFGGFAQAAGFGQHQANTERRLPVRVGSAIEQGPGQGFVQGVFGKGDDPVEKLDGVCTRRQHGCGANQGGDKDEMFTTAHIRVLLRPLNTFWVNKSLHG